MGAPDPPDGPQERIGLGWVRGVTGPQLVSLSGFCTGAGQGCPATSRQDAADPGA